MWWCKSRKENLRIITPSKNVRGANTGVKGYQKEGKFYRM
jgi:hypothetical protein